LSLITAFAVWCGPETNRSDLRADSPEEDRVPAAPPRTAPRVA